MVNDVVVLRLTSDTRQCTQSSEMSLHCAGESFRPYWWIMNESNEWIIFLLQDSQIDSDSLVSHFPQIIESHQLCSLSPFSAWQSSRVVMKRYAVKTCHPPTSWAVTCSVLWESHNEREMTPALQNHWLDGYYKLRDSSILCDIAITAQNTERKRGRETVHSNALSAQFVSHLYHPNPDGWETLLTQCIHTSHP